MSARPLRTTAGLLLLMVLTPGCASHAAADLVSVAVEALVLASNPDTRRAPPRPPPSSDPKAPPHR